ncbi:MAG: ElaA protein [Alphaproteobacteria bacterium]|jgi:ElaA protein
MRSEVFVLEQTCIYQDLDYKDIQTDVHHLILQENEKLLGYARLLPASISYPTPSIGRILICPSARNRGLGRIVIKESLQRAFTLWPKSDITIGAQSHLSNLYQGFGFKEISEHYVEDGIMHVDMQISSK